MLILLALLVLASRLAGQTADSSSNMLRVAVEGLAPSTDLRVGSQGKRWIGRLAGRSPDSLALSNETGTRSIHIAAIDTLWLRREKHDGLLAGAGFGAIMFGLIHIGRNLGDPAQATRFGAAIFLGATTAGLLVDALSTSWVQTYPE